MGVRNSGAGAIDARNLSDNLLPRPSNTTAVVTESKIATPLMPAASPSELASNKAAAYSRSLIEASLDPLVTISPQGQITDVNTATEIATGRNRAALIGSDFSTYFTEPEQASRGYQRAFAEGQVRDYPLAIRHTDGHITHVLYNATVYRDTAGAVQGVVAGARDVTARLEAEAQLRKASAYARSLIEASLTPW